MGATGLQLPARNVSAGILGACVAAAALACVSVASAAGVAVDTNTDDVAAAPTTFAPGVAGTPRNSNFTYGADVGVGYSDNITQTSVNKRSEEILEEGARFSGYDLGARFQGAMIGDLEHLNFLQGTYSPEVIGNFNGVGSYALVPSLLRWMAEDTFGQGLID